MHIETEYEFNEKKLKAFWCIKYIEACAGSRINEATSFDSSSSEHLMKILFNAWGLQLQSEFPMSGRGNGQ